MDRLRQIQIVVRAADTGSFAKAAASLKVTPPAVSHAIAELERELRVSLFYRTTRQLRLTQEGNEFCRRGREIIGQVSALEAATVVVIPSPYESLSLLALEALAVGTPILCNARSEVLVDHCLRSNGGLFTPTAMSSWSA